MQCILLCCYVSLKKRVRVLGSGEGLERNGNALFLQRVIASSLHLMPVYSKTKYFSHCTLVRSSQKAAAKRCSFVVKYPLNLSQQEQKVEREIKLAVLFEAYTNVAALQCFEFLLNAEAA